MISVFFIFFICAYHSSSSAGALLFVCVYVCVSSGSSTLEVLYCMRIAVHVKDPMALGNL